MITPCETIGKNRNRSAAHSSFPVLTEDGRIMSKGRVSLQALDELSTILFVKAKLSDDDFRIEWDQIWSQFDVVDINQKNTRGQTLLYGACRSGRTWVIERLLRVPDIELNGPQESKNDSTALHGANWGGYLEIMAMLLTCGAKPEYNKNITEKKEGLKPEEEGNTLLGTPTLRRIIEFWKCYNEFGVTGIHKFLPPGFDKEDVMGGEPLMAVHGRDFTSLLALTESEKDPEEEKLQPKQRLNKVLPAKLEGHDFCYPKPISAIYKEFDYLFVCENRLYDVKTTCLLNKAFKENLVENLFIITTKPSRKLIINIKTMFQTESNTCKPKISKVEKYRRYPQWYSRTSNGTIQPYEHKINVNICRSYVKKHEELRVIIKKQEFVINLTQKSEINQSTKERNTIFSEDEILPKVQWLPPTEYGQNVKRTEVMSLGLEYSKVEDMFYLSMPTKAQIVDITKIFNGTLRHNWAHELGNVKQSNNKNTDIRYTRMLFHGTGNSDPKLIYESDKGFLINFASDGLWGRGVYFAQDSVYSHKYTYRTPNGNRQMILAEVITGDGITLEEDRSLRLPPHKDEKSGKRFDCVIGVRHETLIYVCYDNGRAYPTYLIEYKPFD